VVQVPSLLPIDIPERIAFTGLKPGLPDDIGMTDEATDKHGNEKR
jgi:hypothetical protein